MVNVPRLIADMITDPDRLECRTDKVSTRMRTQRVKATMQHLDTHAFIDFTVEVYRYPGVITVDTFDDFVVGYDIVPKGPMQLVESSAAQLADYELVYGVLLLHGRLWREPLQEAMKARVLTLH